MLASSQLGTDVLPYTGGPIVPGRNYVYCSTFQMAWDELRTLFKGPIALEGAPPLAEALNAADARGVALDPASFLVGAGFAENGYVEKARGEVGDRFPRSGFDVPTAVEPSSIVAYAFLEKTLPFEWRFERLTHPMLFRSAAGEAGVESFGEAAGRAMGQVKVLSYESDDAFVLRLDTKSPDDVMILAMLPPAATLAATIAAAKDRVRAHPTADAQRWVGGGDRLAVPVISLGLLRSYHEIEGRTVLNAPDHPQSARPVKVAKAMQGVRFRLDETGAVLKSEAVAIIASAWEPEPKPRKFIFDRPFLLYLERRGATQPYLALWIAAPDVLVKWGS